MDDEARIKMKPNRVGFLTLLTQVSLAAPGVSVCPGTASSLNDWSFKALLGAEEEGTSGTLLDQLSGVTATGKGVIVGIIDSGIDWRHPDFRDPADSQRSRILAIWDRESSPEVTGEGSPPEGFDYGRVWTRDEIEAALRGEAVGPPRDPYRHGTFVAGIAAGNGNADPRFRGMAPEAEIVVVAFGVLDGARYMFDLAEVRGRPVVVNYSGGTFLSHSERKELEDLLREKPGRALVASAGNLGQGLRHARFDMTADVSYTIYRTSPREEEPGSELMLEAYHQGPGEAWIGAGLSEDVMVWRSLEEIAEREFEDVTDSLGDREGRLGGRI